MPLTTQWWDGFAFFPHAGTIAFSDHRLGESLMATPLQWMGLSAVTAYNVTLLATFPLSALAAHWLAFTVTRRHDAAVVAGLAYGFNPIRIAHLEHLELLAGFGMPAALAALHLYSQTARRRWLAACAAALAVQALCASYYALFFSVVLALWILWFQRWRDRWKVVAMLIASACGLAVVTPLAIGYWRVHHAYGFAWSFREIQIYSAGVHSLVTASPQMALWGWTAGQSDHERQLFPGLTIIVLAVAGLRRLRLRAAIDGRSANAFAFYFLAALILYWCSLGPTPSFAGRPVLAVAPYAWLMRLPLFAGSVRAPARFAMPAVLMLSMAAALAFDRLPIRPRARQRLALVLAACLLADSWTRALVLPAVPAPWPATQTRGLRAVLSLPLGDPLTDAAAMYRATQLGLRSVNGTSGFYPPSYADLERALRAGDASALVGLAKNGPLLVAVDKQADAGHRLMDFVSAQSETTPIGGDARWSMFRLARRED